MTYIFSLSYPKKQTTETEKMREFIERIKNAPKTPPMHIKKIKFPIIQSHSNRIIFLKSIHAITSVSVGKVNEYASIELFNVVQHKGLRVLWGYCPAKRKMR